MADKEDPERSSLAALRPGKPDRFLLRLNLVPRQGPQVPLLQCWPFGQSRSRRQETQVSPSQTGRAIGQSLF
jgi:hypothetical protein